MAGSVDLMQFRYGDACLAVGKSGKCEYQGSVSILAINLVACICYVSRKHNSVIMQFHSNSVPGGKVGLTCMH